jgi:hypothetical protein
MTDGILASIAKALATTPIKNEVPETMEIAMQYYDSTLKTYADSGLRSAHDWATVGRDVKPECKPRADTLHRGALVLLYTRDQTRALRRAR